MKLFQKALCIMLTIALACLLFGCTPDEKQSSESPSLPAPVTEQLRPSDSAAVPTENASAATQARTEPVEGQSEADTGSKTEPQTEPQTEPETEPETEDPEIESGYTFEIGGNLGVGGN